MKKSYILGILLAIIIIGGLVWFGTSFKFGSDQPRESMVAGTSSTPILLTTIRSEVTAFRGANKESTLVEASTTLLIADSVKTGNVGRALLEDDDFKTVIDHDSEVSIADVAAQKASLELNSGSVWLRVEKVFGKGQGVEVKTPNAIAAVRGTSFGVLYSNGISTLIVTSGTVAFSAKNDPESETAVSAGNKAVLGPDGKIIISPIDQKDKDEEWFKYNNSDTNANDKKEGTINPPPRSPIIPISGNTNNTNSSGNHSNGGSSGSQGATTIVTIPPPQTPPSTTLHIISIDPTKIPPDQRIKMTIYGGGFQTATGVMIGDKQVDFSILNDSTIFTEAPGIAPGTYDIKVIGVNASDTLRGGLVVSLQ